MKTVVTTLNAKYIHGSLALRLLYVANKDNFDISYKEFVIKENVDVIASELICSNYDCIGIGVYIWNVEQVKKLIQTLKLKRPEIIIILGGPEVSYEPEYFLNNTNADYIISGEGEFVLGELLYALENNTSTNIESVSSKENINKKIAQANISKLVNLSSPYQLEEDKEAIKHKVIYFETSRGCPFKCSYCLSSLESGVRLFPKEYIFNNLLFLIKNGAKQIKFLDRSFNLNKNHGLDIFNFLVKNHRENLSCQFEVNADILDDGSINWLNNNLPDNYFRFEIGIQSTYEPTNFAINRKQDFTILSKNINNLINGSKIDLHLDLIAGLPYETFDLFVKSFNEVFEFRAKELQLGFLKMLRGTKLRNEAEIYGYYYEQFAPYQVIYNKYISQNELSRIHQVEHILDKYWNSGRFTLSLNEIFDNYYKNNYFNFFEEFANFYIKSEFKHISYQLSDLYYYLNSFLISKNINLLNLLRNDFYNNFKVRPTDVFWDDIIEKKEKKDLLNKISLDKDFIKYHNTTAYAIKKQTAIDRLEDNKFLLTMFDKGFPKSIIYEIID